MNVGDRVRVVSRSANLGREGEIVDIMRGQPLPYDVRIDNDGLWFYSADELEVI